MLQLIKNEIKNLKSPLYRNSVYISLASLTNALAGFLFWTIAARLYPAEDVGVASAVVSAINLTFVLSMLGMNFAIIRFYPDYRERVVGSALVLTSLAALLFSAVYGLVMRGSNSLGGTFTPEFLSVFVIFSVVGALYNVLYTYAIAKRKAEQGFVQSTLFSLRFVFLFLLVSLGVMGIIGSFGLGLLLGLLYAIIFVDDIAIKLDLEFLREAFRFSLGNYVANIANVAPNYIMPTIVLSMLGKEQAAYYYMAFAIGNMILLVPNSINTSFFVEGSHGLKNIRATLKKAMALSYLYLLVANLGVWLFGEPILEFFGKDYASGFTLLKLIVFGGFFVVPLKFLVTILNVHKRIIGVVMVNFVKAILFLILSYSLIPVFGIEGVGWGWIFSNVAIVLIIRDVISIMNSRTS
ncbi:lipopolysaccharide biosynthesis protein [Thermococcus sp. 18S1]|nr:lipopolysaccharide biosynthesis protein [Thermococcus sp. 18S1]